MNQTPQTSFSPPSAGLLTILIIDDEEAVSTLMCALLEHSGHRVAVADCGQAGIVKALELEPDLVFCDVSMPDMDGHAVLRAMHADERTRHIPFIFLTGCCAPKSVRSGMASGAVDYLLKPFNPEDIEEAIAVCQSRNLCSVRDFGPPRLNAMA